MYSAHGVGYETYCRKHEIRMRIEKSRQQDYLKSQRMIADIGRKLRI
ncbi:hypothetical protein SM124_10345 [Bacillus sp. 31A1R]|uniref:Uncharacterized protein n=1 Tax=Robertmurraya mangrovi TaxID=3098077 RepID=A0ABU5IYH8_9BACI|nr:hypothetical protein [Bacillus sp. 31A1R]MDZ5472147.1 hypothetical protein [Bacillus sp. 31A1R]